MSYVFSLLFILFLVSIVSFYISVFVSVVQILSEMSHRILDIEISYKRDLYDCVFLWVDDWFCMCVCVCVSEWMRVRVRVILTLALKYIGSTSYFGKQPTCVSSDLSGPKIIWQAQNQNWKLKNMWIKWPLHCWPAKKIPESHKNTGKFTL